MMVVGATTALGLREGHSANYPVATSIPVSAEICVAGNVLNANRYRCE